MQITTYKGFKQDLTCRGFQFELGKTFEHKGKVEACSSGFHSCEYPLDCFSYYPPAESRYAEAVADGQISKEDDGDSKIASATITIKAEISVHQLVTRAIEWIWARVDKSLEQTNTGNRSAASNTGDYSAASNTGNRSAASNTGNRSAASNTGNRSAASNTGYQSAASNTGYQSAAEVSGSHSVAAALGIESKARASVNSAIVLCYRNDEGELIHIRASKVGENGIKPDTWYTLNADGQFVEFEE
ncbi:DUF7666 domain-containing protein [Raoultella terrigena]|uniref:DUF7666 domain-containing protein n=1 Tax=Raoultella terrigena TaxID=577 RepID=UPI000978076D|nr:hypothetical protein [Raoultella terrigena]OMP96481.1 hypothetical protein BZP36_01325 [Raoultella terrigena]